MPDYYIIAGNYQEAQHLATNLRVPRHKVHVISDPMRLWAVFRGTVVICVGSYYENLAYHDWRVRDRCEFMYAEGGTLTDEQKTYCYNKNKQLREGRSAGHNTTTTGC